MSYHTLQYTRRLKDAGIDPQHAEAMTEALDEFVEHRLERFATKDDLRTSLAELETRLTVRIGGMLALAVTVLAVLIGIFN